ncbi:hypothetical protein O9929_08265 [Vibrio lentus]|nr:hypothetical protein [Vibrio lentus]
MTNSELFAMCEKFGFCSWRCTSRLRIYGCILLEYLVAASFMAAPGGLLFAKNHQA